MHRKVQVFSMPAKVSIGQDRNKKDPHRGRKLICLSEGSQLSDRNKKDPQRGRKILQCHFLIHSRHKEDPQRGRKTVFPSRFCRFWFFFIEIKKIPKGDEVSFLVIYLIYKKREFLIVTLAGSRTSIGSV